MGTRNGAEDLLLGLIGQAYDAGLGRAPWTGFLEGLAEATHGAHTHILVVDARGRHSLSGAVRSDPETQRRYLEHYASVNPYPTHPAAIHVPGVVHSGHWLPRTEASRTEFYNDFLKTCGVFPVLVGNLFRDRERAGFLATYRPFHGRAHGRREHELLGALLPHVQRAIQVRGLLAEANAERACWAAALDLLSSGIILLDRRGRPTFVNRSARRLLRSGDGLMVKRDGLEATYPADNKALAALVATALRTACGQGLASGGSLAVRRASQGFPLSVLVAPLPPRAAGRFAEEASVRAPAVLICLADPGEAAPTASSDLLTSIFGLTSREAEVGALLAEGVPVGQVAERLAITFHTARVHQRRIYEKVGVHTQAQLVKRVRGICAPVCAGGPSRPA